MNHLTDAQLNEYLDQALNERQKRVVEEHLTSCNQCQRQLDDLEAIFSALEALPDAKLTRDLTFSVLAQLPKDASVLTLWRQPAFLLQSLITLLLLVVSMPILREWGTRVWKWMDELVFPSVQFPSLSEMITQLIAWKPQLNVSIPEITINIPTVDLNLDPNVVLALAISIGMLWMIGNLSLLRGGPEPKE